MAVIASPSVKTATWDGGSASAPRLRPGAWRSGRRGFSTTASQPRGLERSRTICAPVMRRLWLSDLYGDTAGRTLAPASTRVAATASASAVTAPRWRWRISQAASAAATAPSTAVAPSADMGKSTNSAATAATLPTPAPSRSAAYTRPIRSP